MDARFGRWWRRRPAEDKATPEADAIESVSDDAAALAADLAAAAPMMATSPSDDAVQPVLPEQPVLVPAPAEHAPARVGVVLPAARPGALLKHLPVPRIPKRTVLAVGICAGLAAPVVGRQLATQALLALLGQGRATRPLEGATVEIIRIHYAGSAAGHAANAVTKILEQVRR